MASSGKTAAKGDLRFFEGFSWPVPTAFAGAIGAFRFEPGDVLYEAPSGYEKPSRRPKRGVRAIQVLERPSGGPDSGSAETEGDPRRNNWESKLRIAVHDLAAKTQEVHELSQGDLFMTLWRGEAGWLTERGAPAQMPLGARDLAQCLPVVAERLRTQNVEQSKSEKGCRFLFVVDAASDASRAKAAEIEDGLAGAGEVEREDWAPGDADLDSADDYHPALVIRCLSTPHLSVEEATAILRQRLYGGGAGGGAADAADRFSVGRHGLLEALNAAPLSPP